MPYSRAMLSPRIIAERTRARKGITQESLGATRRGQFRLGRQVRLANLHRNPYLLLKHLQEEEPISWVSAVNGWFVTRRRDMLAILLDSTTFSVASAGSFLENTLGRTMLSADGAEQRRLRQPVMCGNSIRNVGYRHHPSLLCRAAALLPACL